MWSCLSAESLKGDPLEREKLDMDSEVVTEPTYQELPSVPDLSWPVLQHRTGLVSDQQMMQHYNMWDR